MLFEAFVSGIASEREHYGSHLLPLLRCAALHEALVSPSSQAHVALRCQCCVRFKLFVNGHQAPILSIISDVWSEAKCCSPSCRKRICACCCTDAGRRLSLHCAGCGQAYYCSQDCRDRHAAGLTPSTGAYIVIQTCFKVKYPKQAKAGAFHDQA